MSFEKRASRGHINQHNIFKTRSDCTIWTRIASFKIAIFPLLISYAYFYYRYKNEHLR